MWRGREGNQRVKVSIVGRLEGVDVFVPVVAGDDDGQVVVLQQVPGYKGPRDAAALRCGKILEADASW